MTTDGFRHTNKGGKHMKNEVIEQEIPANLTRTQVEEAFIGAIDSLLSGNATHLRINVDTLALLDKDGTTIKRTNAMNKFTRLQCVKAMNELRQRAITHGSTKFPLMSKLMPKEEDAEEQAITASSRRVVMKGKPRYLVSLGLDIYHANVKKRKQADARLLAKATAQEMGIAFRVLRRDGTAILNAHDNDSEFHYDMDAAIKVWCRDTYGSNWYVFGQTAQNEARKNEAAEFIELADL
jgi:hypothetical protein